MPEIIKVILLGIVEGLTEFLPISSTGHLIVASAILNFQGATDGTFEIFIQIGAVVAVVVYFRAKLLQQLKGINSNAAARQFWLNLAIAFIPAGITGFLFSDIIDELLFNPTVVALALIIGGLIFILVERRKLVQESSLTLADITPRQALLVGVSQVAALIPGVSRSGATIIAGVLVGLPRAVATEFTFFLSIPVLGLASLYSLYKDLGNIHSSDLVNLIVGAVVSGIVAWLSIRWLLNYVARNNFTAFGYYRIIAGSIILLLVAAQRI